MKKLLLSLFAFLTVGIFITANSVEVKIADSKDSVIIPKEIYGQFAEHLGRCIYDGIWVGKDSNIPNINGYRKDVFEALKALDIPVLRWPGGCFADTYNWRNGIGPVDNRPMIKNVFWGGTMEDNSFGTHEFFNLCEMLECEPYLSANVGSGTVREMMEWIQYVTSDEETPMANLRRENGREEPWKLKYLGVGNESWGCGGSMTPEFYANLYRQYQGYARLYGGRGIYRVACGANSWDANWTDVVMKSAARSMEGISLHYYTIAGEGWRDKGPSIGWEEDLYFSGLQQALMMDSLIIRHKRVMDKHDPRKRVELLVDEWGIWTNQLPGSIPGHLYQQNTLRDALIASTTLDIFHKHTDRVKMANIAQVVNVLQAMVLTSGDTMVLTPTYHVFKMYKKHMESMLIPLEYENPGYVFNEDTIPALSTTMSKTKAGTYFLTISNLDSKKTQSVSIPLEGVDAKKISESNIITSDEFNDYNDFKDPDKVKIDGFSEAKIKKGTLSIELPPMSIVSVEME